MRQALCGTLWQQISGVRGRFLQIGPLPQQSAGTSLTVKRSAQSCSISNRMHYQSDSRNYDIILLFCLLLLTEALIPDPAGCLPLVEDWRWRHLLDRRGSELCTCFEEPLLLLSELLQLSILESLLLVVWQSVSLLHNLEKLVDDKHHGEPGSDG